MTGSGAFATRHLIGVAGAGVASLTLPYVVGTVSSGLSRALDPSGGMHIFSVGMGSGSMASLLGTLGMAMLICMVADLLRRRVPWLTWAFPVLLAVVAGLVMGYDTAWSTGGDELPWYSSLVVGVSFAVLVGVLVGSYWLAMLASSAMAQRLVPESRRRRTRS